MTPDPAADAAAVLRDPRLRAVVDLQMAGARALGLGHFDGVVQDLSPDAVRRGLARLGGPPRQSPFDEALLTGVEAALRLGFDEQAAHRRDPGVHLVNLDISVYDRPGMDGEARAQARRDHLRGWPDAIDAACEALDAVPAVVAEVLLPSVRGLTVGIRADEPGADAALAAHPRLVGHLEALAAESDADVVLGERALARAYGVPEATEVDLGRLADRAESEVARLRDVLADACDALHPGLPLAGAVQRLRRDHPDADEVLAEAREVTAEVRAWVDDAGLVPHHDGDCHVGPAPPSRAHYLAMLEPAGPFAADAPSRYLVTPPDPAWSAADVTAWLEVFNRTALPAITVHEVAPGHFTHFRLLRQVEGPVRKLCLSDAFIEGWAHDVEELVFEGGFRAGDPRYPAGMALEALVRAVRLAVSIGMHTGAMSLDEAVARFTRDAFVERSAARSEAHRATFDPTYGRYTWGKLAIRALRERARRAWGARYDHRGFHSALLALGAPPLGLMDRVLDAPEASAGPPLAAT